MAIPTKRYRAYFDCRGNKAATVKRAVGLLPFVLGAIAAALAVPFAVMNGLRTDPALAEWWTVHVAQGYERFVGTLTSVLPISVFELFVVLLVGAGAYLLVRLVANLCAARFYRIIKGLTVVAVGAAYVLDMYMLSMGFGYYRAPMPLMGSGADYDAKQAAMAAYWFLDDFNSLSLGMERDKNGFAVCPYSRRELAKRMRDEYARLDEGYFFNYTPIAKPVVNSWFLSSVMITGVTFLPTGEANVNVAAPPTTATFTMAHELAHTKGVQREGDANLISYYVMLSSEDDYIRYCGYYATFYSFVSAVSLTDAENPDYADIVRSVAQPTRDEYRATSDYWDRQPDITGQIGEFFNNIYLLFNGAENGTGSYDDGHISGTETPVNPDTDEPIRDPDTGKPVVIPVYSDLQKLYFYLYEQKNGVPPKSNKLGIISQGKP